MQATLMKKGKKSVVARQMILDSSREIVHTGRAITLVVHINVLLNQRNIAICKSHQTKHPT